MNNFNHNNFHYINENNNHQNIKNKSSIINNRYNDLDNDLDNINFPRHLFLLYNGK